MWAPNLSCPRILHVNLASLLKLQLPVVCRTFPCRFAGRYGMYVEGNGFALLRSVPTQICFRPVGGGGVERFRVSQGDAERAGSRPCMFIFFGDLLSCGARWTPRRQIALI